MKIGKPTQFDVLKKIGSGPHLKFSLNAIFRMGDSGSSPFQLF